MVRSRFDEEVRLLSMADAFESLSDGVMEELTRRCHDIHLEAGEVFFIPEEEYQERLFVLKEGRLLIYRVAPEERQMVVAVVEVGKVFGQMMLTTQGLVEVYVKAVEPSVVFVLSRQDLEGLMRSNPEAGLCLVRQLCERLRQLTGQI
jgi:CRP/FNR family transcriptional regulator, cyclic AMP receptor protein